VREAGDLSAGVYDREGNMLAQAVTGTPGHVNAMAAAVGHFIRRIGYDDMAVGDVYITNDPWEGTGHLHDITVVTPAFFKGALVGFFACTAHVVDIGGLGFGADANSVYEEGLYIPIMKMISAGTVNETLMAMVRANVREPDQVVGDIYALATCNEVGQRRLSAMMDEFDLSDLSGIASFILDNSRAATLERINALEHGAADGEMVVDGYHDPITLKVRVEIATDKVLCDFAGTSQGTIVNAVHPAPVTLRHIIGHMLPDTVYDALDKLLPATVPAEGAGTLCNFQVSVRPRRDAPAPDSARRAEVLTFNSGGAGARPTLDGMNATAFPSGVMTMPVEATEHAGPVIIWRKELRPDSGGAGKYRGGLGQYMDVSAAEGHEADFSAMFDRVNYPARGRQGGEDGAPTVLMLDDGTKFRGKGKQFVPHGARVSLSFPGGAGYGKPSERGAEDVKEDLRRGYISAEVARETYGLGKAEIDAVLAAAKRGEIA